MERSMPTFITENDIFLFPETGVKEIYAQPNRTGWQVVATLSGVGQRILASGLDESEKDEVMKGIASGLIDGVPVINFSKKINAFLEEVKKK